MIAHSDHRLDGLEPDNPLAFLALLGLLRTLPESRPDWRARVFWTCDEPPVRPVLRLNVTEDGDGILAVVAAGLKILAARHDFGGLEDLKLAREEAEQKLRQAVETGPYESDLWSALVSDVIMKRAKPNQRNVNEVEPTPMCFLSGQGHQRFLSRLSSVPRQPAPPDRQAGRKKRKKIAISELDCLREALFAPWIRADKTESFRWDPNEDVRYALRAKNPSLASNKELTQHGANRLAAVGLSMLTVVPRLQDGGARLGMVGGHYRRDRDFMFVWPIWRKPMSLAGIRALLGHPHIDSSETREALAIFECRRARRVLRHDTVGVYINFTRALAESDDAP